MFRSFAVFFVLVVSFFASVASAVYPIIVCENLILDADKNQPVMQLNPVLTRGALHREIGRLIHFTEAQIQAVPGEIKDAWDNRVYANDYFGFGFLRSLAHSTGLSTPTEIAELNAKRARLDKRLGRLRALSVLLTQVSHISAVLAPARHLPDIHPDAPFEIEINEWIETRAVESIYALVQLAMVNPPELSDERKQKAETLYSRFVTELTTYSAHLETDADSDSRNPLVAAYLDDVSVAKLAEVRNWAEKELGGPVEKEFLIRLVSVLLGRRGVMSEHLKTLADVHKQSVSILGDTVDGREGFLILAQGVLLKVIEPKQVGYLLRDLVKVTATSSSLLQSLSPQSLAHFIYLHGMTGKSLAELTREFLVEASTLLYQEQRTTAETLHPQSQEVLLLLIYADAKRLGGTGQAPVSELPVARRALERLPSAWAVPAKDNYLASAALISIAYSTQVDPLAIINYIQEIYSFVEHEPIAGCNYRFFEWLLVANFGLEQNIPAKAMVEFLRTARALRGYVPPADSSVLDFPMFAESGWNFIQGGQAGCNACNLPSRWPQYFPNRRRRRHYRLANAGQHLRRRSPRWVACSNGTVVGSRS